MANPTFAQGTQIKIGDGGSPEAFTAVKGIFNGPTGPGFSFEQIDVTNHDSTGGYREFVTGLADGQDLTFTIYYDPDDATHDAATGLLADLDNRTKRNFEIVFPVSNAAKAAWAFAAFVTGFVPNAPHDGMLSADITLKPTGAPTFETAAT